MAAQTTRSRCKFRYTLFRDYRHTRESRLLESESVDSSIKIVIHANDTNRQTHSPYYVRRSVSRKQVQCLYFRLILNNTIQYTKTQPDCKRWFRSNDIFPRRFCYRAKLRVARYCHGKLSVCLSVRPSVTLRYRDHIGSNSAKIISRLISLTISLSADGS